MGSGHGKPVPAWTPFERMTHWRAPTGATIDIPPHIRQFQNSRYSVTITTVQAPEPFGRLTWLSIKRLDRRPIRDWRELQRIKNELAGPEAEAVEIFPAESRLVDTSNQYHLFVMSSYDLPFGYANREVTECPEAHPLAGKAVQEPWPDDNKPADLLGPEAMRTHTASADLRAPIITDKRGSR